MEETRKVEGWTGYVEVAASKRATHIEPLRCVNKENTGLPWQCVPEYAYKSSTMTGWVCASNKCVLQY